MKGFFKKLFKGDEGNETEPMETAADPVAAEPVAPPVVPPNTPPPPAAVSAPTPVAKPSAPAPRPRPPAATPAPPNKVLVGPNRSIPEVARAQRQDGLRWTFEFAGDIDAAVVRTRFLTALAAIPKRPYFPEIERLRGYAEFQKGALEALGVVAQGSELIFEFVSAPSEGFLHALKQPALACIAGTPTADEGKRIGVLAIRPVREMQNQRLRQILIDQVSEVQSKMGLPPVSLFPEPVTISKREPHPRRLKLQQPLLVAVPMTPSAASEKMEQILAQALKDLGWPSRFERVSEAGSQHDLRLIFVDAFPELQIWCSEFLFLSPVGPGLSDPSSRLRLAGRDAALAQKDFTQEFFQALHDDAAVLPLVHT